MGHGKVDDIVKSMSEWVGSEVVGVGEVSCE